MHQLIVTFLTPPGLFSSTGISARLALVALRSALAACSRRSAPDTLATQGRVCADVRVCVWEGKGRVGCVRVEVGVAMQGAECAQRGACASNIKHT